MSGNLHLSKCRRVRGGIGGGYGCSIICCDTYTVSYKCTPCGYGDTLQLAVKKRECAGCGSCILVILVAKSKILSQAACSMTRLKDEVRVCSGASPRSQLIS